MDIAPTAAAVLVKLAYLATGLVVCFLGKGMLEKGVSADFLGEGQIASRKLRIVTSSPGILFLLAGLAILLVAINHQTAVTADGDVKLARAPVAASADVGRLMTQARAVNRATMPEDAGRAKAYLEEAIRCVPRGAHMECLDILVKAVALDPSLTENIQQSPLFDRFARDPAYQAFAAARLRIFLRTDRAAAPLSDDARGLLARIEALASRPAGRAAGAPDAVKSADALLRAGRPDASLLASLELLLERDPAALHSLLSNGGNSWALESDAVHVALSRGLARLAGKANP
jgi:hypothetical protein